MGGGALSPKRSTCLFVKNSLKLVVCVWGVRLPVECRGVEHCEAGDAVRPGAAAALEGDDAGAVLAAQEVDEGAGLRGAAWPGD